MDNPVCTLYTVQELDGIIDEVDNPVCKLYTVQELDGIIDEVDEDRSGTLDFYGFQEMMMG